MQYLSEAATVLTRLESKRPAAKILASLDQQEDCACGRKGSVSRFKPLDTGVTQILNNVCDGCAEGHKMDKELARVVCWGCKKVVMRISPHRDKDGFLYRAGHTYHTNACPVCQKGVESSVLAEKMVWMKKNRG
jgi:hypothetical protein